jgi:TolB-like protein/cytochrome c-type biogenesis protein CcmH/NrfG
VSDKTEGDKDTIWTKLRHRKVVQWGLAYVAGAWALLQGVGFAADAFAWVPIVKQLALLGLIVGLPIVVALAWYHGDRGQQRVTRPELAVLTLLLLLGGSFLWLYAQRSADTTATDEVASPVATTSVADSRPSIAVLPFENRSRQADDAFFVDGIHDDILTQLSKVSALRVISRTSVDRFRKSDLSTQQIAQQLGVRSILEGGVQRAGDRVRINVQLIDVTTDAHVWAETYDRELDAANIFAIQSELAAAIAGVLKTTLTPAEQARANQLPTRSLEAWEAYQRGKQRMAKRTSAAVTEAERHFRDAIALDPDFALAWVGLADSLALQIFYAGRPKDSGLAEAEQAVTRALTLEPNLAEAWASSGNIVGFRFQLEQAEQMLRRAVALNPNYAQAQHWLSMALTDLGRRDEALVIAERALVLDPLSAIINNWVGVARSNVGRFDDALAAYRHAIEIDPEIAIVYSNIGDVHAFGFGRLDTALAWYERAASLDPGNPDHFASVTLAYWNLGDDAEAGRWLDQTLTTGKETGFTESAAALIFLDHGDLKSARSHAQQAAEQDPSFLFLVTDDDFRRGDYTAARAEYAKAYPHLLTKEVPPFNRNDSVAAIGLAAVLQRMGENERAKVLLSRTQTYLRTIPRLGSGGFGIQDVVIHTLRGETKVALARLREAEQAGWRDWWRYYRDLDPNLAAIRNEPEFKAVFADIERDMARQRAALAARPKDAPLPIAGTST